MNETRWFNWSVSFPVAGKDYADNGATKDEELAYYFMLEFNDTISE